MAEMYCDAGQESKMIFYLTETASNFSNLAVISVILAVISVIGSNSQTFPSGKCSAM